MTTTVPSQVSRGWKVARVCWHRLCSWSHSCHLPTLFRECMVASVSLSVCGKYPPRLCHREWKPQAELRGFAVQHPQCPCPIPLSDYVVQFEEDQFQPGVWHDHSKFPGSVNSAILQLSPYVNYQFRVIAINEVGSSHPSLPSERYRTSGAGECRALTEALDLS